MEEIKAIRWLSVSGCGSGSGSGSGDGCGYGDGSQIKQHQSNKVFYIDCIPTVIIEIYGNFAKGYMIDRGSYKSIGCYIAKDELTGSFAHGKTLKEAAEALQEKVFESMSVIDRIQMFCKEFEKDKTYKGSVFFDWHNKLTGSCLMGRNQFVEEKGLSLDDDYTVNEFIKLCENDYGADVIAELKKEWRDKEI